MTNRASHRLRESLEADLAILNHGGSAAISRQPPKQAKRPPRAGTPRCQFILARNPYSEKCLKCSEGDQKCDERVLDRPAALPGFFQAAEVFKGGVQVIAPDDWLFVPYPSADAEAVTHITAPCAFLCVCRIGHSV
jgi:hypothetical protein